MACSCEARLEEAILKARPGQPIQSRRAAQSSAEQRRADFVKLSDVGLPALSALRQEADDRRSAAACCIFSLGDEGR